MSVRQSLLSGAVPTWDINTGVYASKSLSVAAQTAATHGLAFSSDGAKVYVCDEIGSNVLQYTLSTAWDISTGSYAKTLSTHSQDASISGLSFSSDGTKAYVVGAGNKTIYQYTLSTAWDISTGSYASKSLSVATQTSNPYTLTLSSDGTKAYIGAIVSNTFFQYTLSTAWDISTGSYANKSLSVNAQDTNPFGISFGAGGTKFYIVGQTNKSIFQYTLSTAWDISTGSYASKSLSVNAQDTNPTTLAFSPDGTKAYIAGDANNLIFQYNLL